MDARLKPRLQVILILLAVLTAGVPGRSETMAQALGLGANDKALIIHMDDGGMIHSVNAAISDLRQFGLATSTSAMLPCPAVDEFTHLVSQNKLDDVGVHVTLTSEWSHYRWGPVLPPDLVESLTDKGFFWSTVGQVWANSAEAEGEREIEAQVEKAFHLGLHPTHLDTHMGTILLHEGWVAAYLKLASRYHLAPMITRDVKFAGEEAKWMKYLRPTLNHWIKKAEMAGYLSLDSLILDVAEKDYSSQKARYIEILKSLSPGVTQIIIHPGYADDDFKSKVIASSAREIRRDFDARVFQDPEIKQLIADLHIRLIGWKDILAVYPWKAIKP